MAYLRSSVFPGLKADVRTDKADRTSLLIHGFWLGEIRIVFVGTTSTIHSLMKHVTYLNTPLCRHQMLPGTCPSPRDQNSPVV